MYHHWKETFNSHHFGNPATQATAATHNRNMWRQMGWKTLDEGRLQTIYATENTANTISTVQ